ncbi:diguanylate cyclase [Colwellia psychrerythraea]|uniref:diguanylate cyclase n=1 Tax=Colwellia psychrerythraea TaxID=28229 RepID=A0A099KAE8_COLPS|nr:diguanylate cyclase [Colwellia psychrerythraea]KGJ87669.1 response regulator receiver modulated diguanylate cyclase [Colwellia psychrerythraea]
MVLDKEYTVLVVDDAKDTQMLLEFDLSAAGYHVTSCDSGEQSLALLENNVIDLILLDMYMPGLSGLETLTRIKAQAVSAQIPVIMLSASTDEDEVVAALELGAGDYVIKPYVAKVLLARIRTAIRLKEKTAQLEYLAKTDFLTGMNNRGSFFELSSNAISLANRAEQPLVAAMFDIDLFKQVNDNYGHDVGDQVLRSFSKTMTEVFRDYDIVGRIGGEEFAVCLPNTSCDDAFIACERLRSQVEKLSITITNDEGNELDIKITVSVGLVLAQDDYQTIDELLKQADSALYYAKAHGRNQVVNANTLINPVGIERDAIEVTLAAKDKSLSEQEGIGILNYDGIDFDIGVNNVLGDEALFKEILVMFYQDHHLDGQKLQSAILEQDIVTAKHIAHTLKGVACSVGAMDLFEVTKALDLAINENDKNDLDGLFSLLSPELNRVMKGIELHLDIS